MVLFLLHNENQSFIALPENPELVGLQLHCQRSSVAINEETTNVLLISTTNRVWFGKDLCLLILKSPSPLQ